MNTHPKTQTQTIVRIRGQNKLVPSIIIEAREIVCTGRLLRTAMIKDEAFVEGDIVKQPNTIVETLRRWGAQPDIFTFCQKFTQPSPRFQHYFEYDNFAVIPITTYEYWLRHQAKKDVRENIRRAKREGVEVRNVIYSEAFIRDIKGLYDETPIRQGKPFWHYNKTLAELDEIHGTYRDRAEYLGAYLGSELIGFLKMVYVGDYAKTMHVFGNERHFTKRPTNALLAKAVETCAEKRITALVYGEYRFPGKNESTLSNFKQHHGFEERLYPRYFIPLSFKGRVAIRLRLHQDPRRHIPNRLLKLLLRLRSNYYQSRRSPA